MAWHDITITDAGERLLSGMVNGSKLTLTRAEIGSGTVPVEELAAQTKISEPISAPALLAGQERTEDNKGMVVKLQIRNDGVSETTRMRQIAIYAETDHENEVLFVILQDKIGEEIPAYDEFPQFEIQQWVTIAVSRTNNINVIISPDAYALADEFNELKKRVEKLENGSSGMIVQDIVIPTDSWTSCPEEQFNCLSVDIPVEDVTEDMWPVLEIDPVYDEIIAQCKLSMRVRTLDGVIRIYTESVPAQPINAVIRLFTSSGAVSGGSGIYKLPIASFYGARRREDRRRYLR